MNGKRIILILTGLVLVGYLGHWHLYKRSIDVLNDAWYENEYLEKQIDGVLTSLNEYENNQLFDRTLPPSFSGKKTECKNHPLNSDCQLLKADKDLLPVQAFSGHKYSSVTEHYKQTHVEVLKQAVLKHHP